MATEKKLEFGGSCWSLEEDFPRFKKLNIKCCNSCVHEMEDYGEAPHDVESDKRFYQVCCHHHTAWVEAMVGEI